MFGTPFLFIRESRLIHIVLSHTLLFVWLALISSLPLAEASLSLRLHPSMLHHGSVRPLSADCHAVHFL